MTQALASGSQPNVFFWPIHGYGLATSIIEISIVVGVFVISMPISRTCLKAEPQSFGATYTRQFDSLPESGLGIKSDF